MKGKVFEMVAHDGRQVCRHGDKVSGPITLDQTEHKYEFVLGCHFVSTERAEKIIGQRVKQAVRCAETNRTAEYFCL